MQISAVEPRRKSQYEIYIDGESAGVVDLETAERMHIRAGVEITNEEWALLCEESERNRAKEYALYLLERRSYPRRKLIEKIRAQYSLEAAEAAADRLEELGLINDEDYARRYATDLFRLRNFSRDRIVQELIQRGIDRDLAKETAGKILEEAEETPEERIRTLLENKFSRALADEKGQRKTVATLQRMGYRWDEIRPVLREYLEELEEE